MSMRGTPRMPHRRNMASWRRVPIAVLSGLLLAAGEASAAPPRHTFDTDPVRLGRKSFEAGRLDEAEARFQEALAEGYQPGRAYFGLGDVAARRGRLDDAEAAYRAALDAGAGDSGTPIAEIRAGLGLTLLRGGRTSEAEQEFERAIADKPNLWEARYGLARLRLAAEDWDAAAELLRHGKDRRGAAEREDAYRYGMALLHLGRGEAEAAEKQALLAFHINPAEGEYGVLVSRIYRDRGLLSLAVSAFEQALAAPEVTPTSDMLYELATLYRDSGRYNDARDRYLETIAADSTHAPALRDLAALYRRANQPDLAAKVYLRYTEAAPQDVDAAVALAEVCLEAGRPEDARAAARRALAADSTRTAARVVLVRAGFSLADTEARDEALSVYLESPDAVEWGAEDHLAAGTRLRELERGGEAEVALRRALAAQPERADALYQLGILELGAGAADSAIAHLAAASRNDSTSALYALNHGIALYQAQRYREAVAPIRRALAVNDRLTVGFVLLGQALAMSDSLAAATDAYEQALEREPDNAKAMRGLGYCAIRRADYGAAARHYEAATRAEPNSADAWAGLGNAYLGLQNWDGAESAFARARAIDPRNQTMLKGSELLEQARRGGGR